MGYLVMELTKRKFEQNGFAIVVARVLDECPDTSYLDQDYSDCTPEEQATYKAQDAQRLAEYNNGFWHYCGVCVSIRKNTDSNWADGGLEIGRASVWGIESDSDESYFAEVECDMIAEALAEVEKLKQALLS